MKILTCSQFLSLILLHVTFREVTCVDPIPEFPIEGKGWLRICDKADVYIGAEKSEDCSAGFWFDPPLSIGCVCGNGIWILSTGWCDTSYITLIMRKGECYYIGEGDIKYIRNIGNTQNAYGEYHFVYTTGFEYVESLTEGGNEPAYSYFHPTLTLNIGSIRPTSLVVQGKDGRTCINPRRKGVLTIFGYDSRLKEYARRQGYTLAKSCSVGRDEILDSDLHGFPYDYAGKVQAIDTDWSKSKPTTYSKDATKCAKCDPINAPKPNVSYFPSWDIPGWSPRQAGNGTTFDLAAVKDFPSVDYPESSEANVTGYYKEVDCKTWKFANGSKNETLGEINEQTKRMISAHIAYSLRKIQTPPINMTDYLIFQKSRKILLQVCPETEVPPELLNGLIRMFRVALRESLLIYPYQQMANADEIKLITESLTKCYDGARGMTFVYDNSTCPKQFLAVNYTYKIATDEFQRNLSAGMPCALKTNGSSYDLPLEAAWKTVMFAHYYCARHFNSNAIEHSRFEQTMESFFNRWMQHRWRNPGPSLEAYKYIFQMHDLEEFSKGLDRCVAASRTYSPYRKWIRRPAYLQFCGKNVFSHNGLVMNAELLEYMTASRNPNRTHFNKKAYCSMSWHEPKQLFKLKPMSGKSGGKECLSMKFEMPGDTKEVRLGGYLIPRPLLG